MIAMAANTSNSAETMLDAFIEVFPNSQFRTGCIAANTPMLPIISPAYSPTS
jgi:hypothetical protein